MGSEARNYTPLGGKLIHLDADAGVIHRVHPARLTAVSCCTSASWRWRRNRLPVTICLFNDRGYGVLRRIEKARFGGRRSGVDLATPDFPALARSTGVGTHVVAGVDQFRAAYRATLQTDGPALLDIDLNALHPIGEYPPRPR